MGSSEKQKIIMQISAVQTDIKRNMEERWVVNSKEFKHKLAGCVQRRQDEGDDGAQAGGDGEEAR